MNRNVVVVSQNKPDHCHGETLRQLRPDGKTVIAAEPGAAKAIKKWKHFDPQRVVALPKFNPRERFSSLRLSLPPLSPSGHPGEVVISFIPAKNYASGLHNAIGITYQPPTHIKTLATVSTVDLPRRTPYFHMPLSPASLPARSPPSPLSPVQRHSAATFSGDFRSSMPERPKKSGLDVNRPKLRSSRTGSSDFLPFQQMPVVHSPSLPSPPSDEDFAFPTFLVLAPHPDQVQKFLLYRNLKQSSSPSLSLYLHRRLLQNHHLLRPCPTTMHQAPAASRNILPLLPSDLLSHQGVHDPYLSCLLPMVFHSRPICFRTRKTTSSNWVLCLSRSYCTPSTAVKTHGTLAAIS